MYKKRSKTASFYLHYSILRAGIVQCQKGSTRLERVPLAGKESLGRVTSLLSFGGRLYQGPTLISFHSDHQIWDIQRQKKGLSFLCPS